VHDDRLDQAAQCCDQFRFIERGRVCGHIGKPLDVGQVTADGGGMQRHHLVGLRGRGELRLHLVAFLLQGLHVRADRIEVADALGDGVDQALQLAGDFAGAARQVFFAVAVLPRQAPALFVIGFDIFGDGLGVCEFIA
jgi:hypothetical protein